MKNTKNCGKFNDKNHGTKYKNDKFLPGCATCTATRTLSTNTTS